MGGEMRDLPSESPAGVNRRAFLQMLAGGATGAVIGGGLAEQLQHRRWAHRSLVAGTSTCKQSG